VNSPAFTETIGLIVGYGYASVGATAASSTAPRSALKMNSSIGTTGPSAPRLPVGEQARQRILLAEGIGVENADFAVAGSALGV
jgi:hypothetical protein